jgi:hypothetical protein
MLIGCVLYSYFIFLAFYSYFLILIQTKCDFCGTRYEFTSQQLKDTLLQE